MVAEENNSLGYREASYDCMTWVYFLQVLGKVVNAIVVQIYILLQDVADRITSGQIEVRSGCRRATGTRMV
jgi:hypothetical protein